MLGSGVIQTLQLPYSSIHVQIATCRVRPLAVFLLPPCIFSFSNLDPSAKRAIGFISLTFIFATYLNPQAPGDGSPTTLGRFPLPPSRLENVLQLPRIRGKVRQPTLSTISPSLTIPNRLARPFVPPAVTLKQIHDAVPKHLMQKNIVKSIYYVSRDFLLAVVMFAFAAQIEPMAKSGLYGLIPGPASWHVALIRAGLWLVYWWWQGLIFAGFFCIGMSSHLSVLT